MVTEDQYKKIVKGRLQRDDFVVDDGIDGYADNGMDEWESARNGAENQSEEDEGFVSRREWFIQHQHIVCPGLKKDTQARKRSLHRTPQSLSRRSPRLHNKI